MPVGTIAAGRRRSGFIVVTGAPQLVTTASNPGATSITYPSGIQADDVAILCMAVDTIGGTTFGADPTGFTAIQDLSSGAGARQKAWWKRCTGSESGSTISVSVGVGTGLNCSSVYLLIYRGCINSGTPIEASGIGENTSALAGTATRTVSSPDRTLVHFYNVYRSSATITPGTGYTADLSAAAGGGGQVARAAVHHRYLTIPIDVAERASLGSSVKWGSIYFSLIPQTVVSSTTPYANDPFWSYNKLLAGFESSIADESASARTLTAAGNAQRSTAQAKYGSASALFDGTADYITAPDSTDWDVGLEPFTVELFARFTTKTNSQALLGQWDNAGTASNCNWFLWVTATPNLVFRVANGSSTFDCLFSFTPTLSTWYHIAVDRDIGGKTRLYVNGSMVASTTTQNLSPNNSTNVFSIGRIGTGTTFSTNDLNGNLDEIRFTKGIARYNSDSGFTVPAAAFPRSA